MSASAFVPSRSELLRRQVGLVAAEMKVSIDALNKKIEETSKLPKGVAAKISGFDLRLQETWRGSDEIKIVVSGTPGVPASLRPTLQRLRALLDERERLHEKRSRLLHNAEGARAEVMESLLKAAANGPSLMAELEDVLKRIRAVIAVEAAK